MNKNHSPSTGEFTSGGGGGGGGAGERAKMRAQFDFLDLRIRTGGLKKGELSMIEKRRDQVAQMILNSPEPRK